MTNQDYFNRIEELMRSLRDVSDSITRERQQDERDNAEHRRERAEAARNGELGEDWKKIQERIDKGETTLSDVFKQPNRTSRERCSRHAKRLKRTMKRTLSLRCRRVSPLSARQLKSESAIFRASNKLIPKESLWQISTSTRANSSPCPAR